MRFLETVALIQGKLVRARNGGKPMKIRFAESPEQQIIFAEQLWYEAAIAKERNEMVVFTENGQIREELKDLKAANADLQAQLSRLLRAEADEEEEQICRRCCERYKESLPSKLVVFEDNGPLSKYDRVKNALIKFNRRDKLKVLAGVAKAREEAVYSLTGNLKRNYFFA
mmetsp:Transcript_4285/g.10184  ORF Transcript_4285/g.10184 Transcript_4285/m.10184 type:complete len:170 (-) Transcript_4285:2-511(-)